MHTSVYWLPKVYKPRGEVINNNMFTRDWKCARSHAMSWYNTHHLPSPICLPQQGKHRPRWLHSAFAPQSSKSTLETDFRGSFGSHGWPTVPWGETGKCQGPGAVDTVGALTGKRWIPGNHYNQQIRVILSRGQTKGEWHWRCPDGLPPHPPGTLSLSRSEHS